MGGLLQKLLRFRAFFLSHTKKEQTQTLYKIIVCYLYVFFKTAQTKCTTINVRDFGQQAYALGSF